MSWPMSGPMSWPPGTAGVLRLPSGRLVRGRGLRGGPPDGPLPSYGVYLLGAPPAPVAWEADWLRWPDFRLPADHERTRAVLTEALRRSGAERVEVACGGGRGRTGTALAAALRPQVRACLTADACRTPGRDLALRGARRAGRPHQPTAQWAHGAPDHVQRRRPRAP